MKQQRERCAICSGRRYVKRMKLIYANAYIGTLYACAPGTGKTCCEKLQGSVITSDLFTITPVKLTTHGKSKK